MFPLEEVAKRFHIPVFPIAEHFLLRILDCMNSPLSNRAYSKVQSCTNLRRIEKYLDDFEISLPEKGRVGCPECLPKLQVLLAENRGGHGMENCECRDSLSASKL